MTARHVRPLDIPLPNLADASPEATDGWPREAADQAADDICFSTFLGPPQNVDPSPATSAAPRPNGCFELPSTKLEVFVS